MRGGFEYALVGIVALLAFFCFLIGMDKMIKLIIGTTILIVLVLGRSALLQTLLFHLNAVGASRSVLGIAQGTLISIIKSIDVTTSILLFVGLMIVMMTYTHVDVMFDSFSLSPQAQQLLLVPAAIVSLMIGIAVAVLGVSVFDPLQLQKVAFMLTNNPQVQTIVSYLPLGLLIQGTISLALISSRGVAFGKSE